MNYIIYRELYKHMRVIKLIQKTRHSFVLQGTLTHVSTVEIIRYYS